MSPFLRIAPFFEIALILVLGGMLIRRKLTGQWKRPWSFPVAMGLLGLALVLASLGTVLRYFGM
jgi:hypothetical protein